MVLTLQARNQEGQDLLKHNGFQWTVVQTNLEDGIHKIVSDVTKREVWIAIVNDPRVIVIDAR